MTLIRVTLSAILKERIFYLLVGLLFFSAVLLFFARPLIHGDIWWHLGTGQWIWQHMELPSEDPFSHTSDRTGYENRKALILKGYWLSQIIYYLTYKFLGFPGLILFNASLFTLIFYVLWNILRDRGMEPLTGLLMIVPCVLLSRYFYEIRPHVFSFLNTLLLFHIIEKGFQKLKTTTSATPFAFLPFIMLLWANLHTGFIVGYAVLGGYLLTETYKYIYGSNGAFAKARYRKFLFWTAASVFASLLNPNFISPLFIGMKSIGNPFTKTLLEYKTPWEYSFYRGAPYFLYGLIAVAALTFVFMLASYRRLKLSDVLLYIGFAAAAATAQRFSMFFILMSTAVSSKYAALIAKDHLKKLRPVTALIVTVSAVFIFVSAYRTSYIRHGPINDAVLPVKSADFLTDNGLPPPVFNPYEWGGYLIWRLYPQYKVFVDARMMDYSVYEKYRFAKQGEKTALFNEYGINTVVFYTTHHFSIPGIILSLLTDREWRLVYFDGMSTVFVRTDLVPALPSIKKEALLGSLFMFAYSEIKKSPQSSRGYNELGNIYSAIGQWDKAKEYFRIADSIDSKNKKY